jgi:hypothetical protein
MQISGIHMNPYSNTVNFSGISDSEKQTKNYAPKEHESFNAMLGVTALAASGIAAIALRGKHNALKALKELTLKAEEFSNLKLKNIDIDLFEKVGKFEDGKAFIGDKLYTGNIYTKNGYKMTYEKGILSHSETDIDLFKKVGKFEKGKAFIGDKLYTGDIYTKNGYKITYENGVLSHSETIATTQSREPVKFKDYNSEGKLIFSRNNDYKYVGRIKDTEVEYLEDGTIVKTQKRVCGGRILRGEDIITTIKPDGTITRLEQNLSKTSRGLGQNIIFDKTTNLKTGEFKLTKNKIEPRESYIGLKGSTIRSTKIVDGQKVYERVGKDGKVTSWTNQYDAKTGVAIQTIKNPDGRITTKMRDKNGNVLDIDGGFYRYYNAKDPSMYTPYGSGGTSKKVMQAYIKNSGLPFVIE